MSRLIDGLDHAIEACGSVAELARRIGVSAPAIFQWESCPSDRVLAVAEATGWVVTPHVIRPDLYPNETDGLPADMVRCERCKEPA